MDETFHKSNLKWNLKFYFGSGMKETKRELKQSLNLIK